MYSDKIILIAIGAFIASLKLLIDIFRKKNGASAWQPIVIFVMGVISLLVWMLIK